MTTERDRQPDRLRNATDNPYLHESWKDPPAVGLVEIRADSLQKGPATLRMVFDPQWAPPLRGSMPAVFQMQDGLLELKLGYVAFTAGQAIYEVLSARVLPPEAPAPQDAVLPLVLREWEGPARR